MDTDCLGRCIIPRTFLEMFGHFLNFVLLFLRSFFNQVMIWFHLLEQNSALNLLCFLNAKVSEIFENLGEHIGSAFDSS